MSLVDEAVKAYDDGRVDGFFTIATTALAYQWSAHVRLYSDLMVSVLPASFGIARGRSTR